MADTSHAGELTPSERADIERMSLLARTGTLYGLLRVPENADRKSVRDAYFRLSKQFHPDAFYGRDLGAYREQLDGIFRSLTHAYDVLGHKSHRAEYDRSIGLNPDRPLVALPEPSRPESDPAPAAYPSHPSSVGNHHGTRASTAPPPYGAAPPSIPSAPARPAGPTRTSSVTQPAIAGPPRSASVTQPAVKPPPITPPPLSSGPSSVPPAARATVPPGASGAREPLRPPTSSDSGRPSELSQGAAAQRAPLAPGAPSSSEEAQRLAREALARRLANGRALSNPSMPAVQPGAVSAGASLQSQLGHREDLATKSKLHSLRTMAHELAAKGDFLGAANTMQLAVGLAGDDASVKAEAQAMQVRLAEQMAPQNQAMARDAERARQHEKALVLWQKVLLARPDDYEANLRYGRCLLTLGRELPRAAEAARKVIAAAPSRAEGHLLLAEVFASADKRVSAKAAAEQAAKLDPGSQAVKDLLARLR